MAKKQPDANEQEAIQFAEQMGRKYTQELISLARRIAQSEQGKLNGHYVLRAEYRLISKRYKELMRSEAEFAEWKEANLPE